MSDYNSNSILDSIKNAVDIPEDYDVFDSRILIHINSVFSTLNQLGIGPVEGFQIEDSATEWDDLLHGDSRFNNIKSYIYLRVRMLFDPPATSFALDALKEQAKELEWRINVQREDLLNPIIP